MFSSIIYFSILLVLLATSVFVATALLFLGVAGDWFTLNIIPMIGGNIIWSTMNSYLLITIPLFVLLGEVLTRSGVADRMYVALSHWVRWLPGGLLHSNIAASAMFSAVSGSSVATAATIGTVAQPTLNRYGYSQKMVLGTIAAGGTLGILIPPSVNMIVYGALTNTPVNKLFAAGLIPGLVLAVTMSITIVIIAIVGRHKVQHDEKVRLAQRLRSLLDIVPVLLVFVAIMGSIYAGIATPTESASFGLVAALGLAAWNRTLTFSMLNEAMLSCLRTTAMILLIIVCAFVLNFQLSATGVPQQFAEWVLGLGFGPTGTIWLLVAFYVLLGCFLESMAMMVTTIGIVFPLVVALGLDPVWFGIFMTLMMEIALITPPVGLNLFVVQNIRLRNGPISDVYIGTLPFAASMLVFIGILIYFPQVALWLPSKMF